RCQKWIGMQASSSISVEAKFAIARAAQRIMLLTCNSQSVLPDLSAWILSIQPVPQEAVGTWQAIEGFLCDMLKKDREQFIATFERLSVTRAGIIQGLMHDRHLRRLQKEMRTAEIGDLVGRLCVAPDVDTRRLGMYLFDTLEIPTFP